ncbi:uncharacterized protein LOC144349248 [Saccoglossus kowalevskii]
MGTTESKDNLVKEILNTNTLTTTDDKKLAKYIYPFENLVLEGGGVKGVAYAGLIKVLMDVGIYQNIKRFAGASIGSMLACLLSVGYPPTEAILMMNRELKDVIEDHSCGVFSLLPNLITKYGWNPATKFYKWFGTKLEDKTGNKDITFKELFDLTGNELCITVSNVSRRTVEYCHIKTTPNMVVRMAVRMSISFPGVFEAVQYQNGEHVDIYVDGGVLANFPLHCFDGWWLSSKPEDSFLIKLQPLSQMSKLWSSRFDGFNNKTLGAIVDWVIRDGGTKAQHVERPDTDLARGSAELERKKKELEEYHDKIFEAFTQFLKVLSDNDVDKNSIIDRNELRKALEMADQSTFTTEHARTLFGEQYDFKTVLDLLDANGDGKINGYELVKFAESRGIDIQSKFTGYDRIEITSLGGFVGSMIESMTVNLQRLGFNATDAVRTIGIDVGYLGSMDFEIEPEDSVYAIKQGMVGTLRYLRYYVKKFNPPVK